MPATNAQDFYGAAYKSAPQPERLDKAFQWLNKAMEFEKDPTGESKFNMAFKAALKSEAEGLGTDPAFYP